MATLYVENVPDDLYEALRKRARSHRRSIAAEVLELLEQHIPAKNALSERRSFARKLERLRATFPRRPGSYPSAEEMVREYRSR